MKYASLWPVKSTLRTARKNMQQPPGTPNDEGSDNAEPEANAETVGYVGGRRRKAPSKFAYPSGATPLAGFTLKRGLGIGGFGEVYYAVSDAGKDVALKRIQRNLDIELRGVRQCLNLKHPNLLSVHDIRYDEEDQAWVVMEYVAGESMQDAIQRNPNGLPSDEFHRWFDGTLAGVAHLHASGIVHRDLKPGNIFMDGDIVKIGDYGLSKFISCSRRSGQTQSVGTFHYMAPEIGLGRYGKEIDIYAVGIMLYELLTGRVPYDGESSQEIIMKHLTAQPDLSKVSAPYREIISKALAKDPEQRTSSISEIQNAMPGAGPVIAQQVTATPVMAASAATGLAATGIAASADGVLDEPILKFFTTVWTEIGNALSELGMPLRIFVIIVGVIVLSPVIGTLAGLAVPIGLAYCVYFFVRTVTSARSKKLKRSAAASLTDTEEIVQAQVVDDDVAVAQPANWRHRYRRRGRPKPTQAYAPAPKVRVPRVKTHELRPYLQEKSFLTRATELLGAMILGTFGVAASAAGLEFVASADRNGPEPLSDLWLGTFAWVGLTSLVAAWIFLALGKLWENSSGDGTLRRIVSLVAGVAIGVISHGLYEYLLIEPDFLINAPSSRHSAFPALVDGGRPNQLGFAVFFAGLFSVLRWWKQADPLRRWRLNLFTMGICVVFAIAMHAAIAMPHGFVIAAATAFGVQLGAHWIIRDQRNEWIATETQKRLGATQNA